MSKRIELLIIDPQIDFCDPDKGALYVPNAEHDMRRLAAMIRRLKDKIDDIHITLDSHHFIHIAHPIFWKDSHGKHPQPFTSITLAEVEDGKWTTTQPGLYKRALEYVRKLANNGRYDLTIWPPHCLIGSPGHAVFPPLFDALKEWEQRFAFVDFVTKGSRLTLGVSQPLRLARGTASLNLPQSVQIRAPGEYSYLYEANGVNLTPSGREIRYTMDYSQRLSDSARFSLSGMAISQPGHNANARMGIAGMASVKLKF